MSKQNEEHTNKKSPSVISEQITFRHSESVKAKTAEISREENLRIADINRKIFNAGLSSLYGVKIRGNQVVS